MAPAFAATDSERSVTKQDGRHKSRPYYPLVRSLPTNCRGAIYRTRLAADDPNINRQGLARCCSCFRAALNPAWGGGCGGRPPQADKFTTPLHGLAGIWRLLFFPIGDGKRRGGRFDPHPLPHIKALRPMKGVHYS